MTKKVTKKKVSRKANLVRHGHDHSRWYIATPVTEQQVVETLWGEAIAEPGTFIMTDSEDSSFQIICTQDDLDNEWTTDPVPAPPEPGPPIEQDPPIPTFPDLPGESHRHGA